MNHLPLWLVEHRFFFDLQKELGREGDGDEVFSLVLLNMEIENSVKYKESGVTMISSGPEDLE